jgi:hypothetical protein
MSSETSVLTGGMVSLNSVKAYSYRYPDLVVGGGCWSRSDSNRRAEDGQPWTRKPAGPKQKEPAGSHPAGFS